MSHICRYGSGSLMAGREGFLGLSPLRRAISTKTFHEDEVCWAHFYLFLSCHSRGMYYLLQISLIYTQGCRSKASGVHFIITA